MYIHTHVHACIWTRIYIHIYVTNEKLPENCLWTSRSVVSLLQGLHCFVLMLTTEGKVVYVSDTISHLLGHSQVSVHSFMLLVCWFAGTPSPLSLRQV